MRRWRRWLRSSCWREVSFRAERQIVEREGEREMEHVGPLLSPPPSALHHTDFYMWMHNMYIGMLHSHLASEAADPPPPSTRNRKRSRKSGRKGEGTASGGGAITK